MRTDQNKNIPKNKALNNSMSTSSIINLDEVNKAIELTRFNVSLIILLLYLNYIEN